MEKQRFGRELELTILVFNFCNAPSYPPAPHFVEFMKIPKNFRSHTQMTSRASVYTYLSKLKFMIELLCETFQFFTQFCVYASFVLGNWFCRAERMGVEIVWDGNWKCVEWSLKFHIWDSFVSQQHSTYWTTHGEAKTTSLSEPSSLRKKF